MLPVLPAFLFRPKKRIALSQFARLDKHNRKGCHDRDGRRFKGSLPLYRFCGKKTGKTRLK
ncbi:hypothetical protein [Microcoleus sp.]|uniref:hypothetical protein n=1 Tax=Microcoleus sp. TaxID=44472 RepID=UPI003525E2A3